MPAARTPSLRRAALALVGGAIAAAALGSTAQDAEARRIFVPRQEKTIQAAIDRAESGDTIWVAAGVYPGGLRIDRKKLVLFGDGGPERTILDGGDSVRVLHVADARGSGVIGFTIRRGRAPTGGGIFCLRDTAFTISGCTIRGNWEAGVSAWDCAGVIVNESNFEENRGGGLVLNASHNSYIIENRFIANTAHLGGAIAVLSTQLSYAIRECLFERNRAEGSVGGAVLADSSDVQLTNCTFTENRSAVAGGAVAAVEASRVSITSCRFRANEAAQSGAVHGDHSWLNVSQSIFDRNLGGVAGSAIGILSRQTANVNPVIARCTFYKNTTENTGGTIFCAESAPEIRRNIFVVEGKNKAVFGPGTSPLFDCNLIHDPTGAALGALPSANTLVGDPLFCDPDRGDFKLRDLSPAHLAPCGPIGAQGKGCSTFRPVDAR